MPAVSAQQSSRIPVSLYNISSLVFLAVASNQLRGEIPVDVGDRLPNLLNFNFCINKFTGSIPWSLHNLTNIQSIRMAHNLLSGYVPSGLGNLPELQMYNIGYNQIKSSGDEGLNFLTSFINSSYLNFLAIDGNLLEGLIPESIGNLSGSLRSLYLGGNRIYGRIQASIRHLRSLALPNISYNYVSGEIPPEIGELKICKSCIWLQIRYRQLVSMDLSSNRLSGSIPKEIFSLSSLSATLNLSSNQLTGSLPQEIKGLENVAAVDFSHNHLSGSIPDTIGSWKSLEKLFMENNMFSGVIPATLGDVKGLEILDLSSNQISGIIPNNLENLQALHLLNLSFNDLEGLLPKEGAFINLSRIHVEGNSKLCLDLTCWNNQHRKRTSTAIYIVIASIATVAVCSVIAVLLCVRKRKGKIMPRAYSIKLQHPTITYRELRKATGSFDTGNLIGKGSFGSVYKGELGDGTVVAVKVLDIEKYGSWKSFLAECEALKNGSKRRLDGGLLNILERLNVAIDVACAVDYLHHDCEIPVVHCDLKPSNVLFDKDMTAKVGDFGLAKLLAERGADQQPITCTGGLRGSIGYIPPAFPASIEQVVDPELFTGKSATHECLITILGVGLSCSVDSPDRRTNMRESLLKLKTARDTLLKPPLDHKPDLDLEAGIGDSSM
uniref:Protein kinase domain-containing protein n=1 Tax=Populus alba TaxID=43335 RepID=A0A4U5QJM9_POPAL|nr:hypothetical protein D5086_0000079690 [Populus alba]